MHTLATLTGVVVPPELERAGGREKKKDYYSKEVLDAPRDSPWGTTQRSMRLNREFSLEQFKEINDYCRTKKIEWYKLKVLLHSGRLINPLWEILTSHGPIIKSIGVLESLYIQCG